MMYYSLSSCIWHDALFKSYTLQDRLFTQLQNSEFMSSKTSIGKARSSSTKRQKKKRSREKDLYKKA